MAYVYDYFDNGFCFQYCNIYINENYEFIFVPDSYVSEFEKSDYFTQGRAVSLEDFKNSL